jgi:hypothetical protein
MLSRRTIIGLIIGSVIIGIGGYSLITHIGTITVNEHYFVNMGDSARHEIPAPAQSPESITITGDSFDLKLQSPGDGLQIPKTSYKSELTLDWVHAVDGTTIIQIQNTGNSELEISGKFVRSFDPLLFTYDLMVIVSGMVIIGFSMGFSLRKPKGF